MNKFLDIIVHFFRRILQITTSLVISVACILIYVVTFEPGKQNRITRRKVNRVRRLTKFKLWLWRMFPGYFKFIRRDAYFMGLERKFGKLYGM